MTESDALGGDGKIRSDSVLPAAREEVRFVADDGVDLVGELSLPIDGDPVATLVTLHPFPAEGGSMDAHLLAKAAWRLPALARLAVVRFNVRGVASDAGRSGGEFADGAHSDKDLDGVLAWVGERGLPAPWLVGWSGGADVALRLGPDRDVRGAVLLSPMLRYASAEHIALWSGAGRPLTVLVPEFDDYVRPDDATAAFAGVASATVQAVPGGKHFFRGESYVRQVLDGVVQGVGLGSLTPLPVSFVGPVGCEQEAAGRG